LTAKAVVVGAGGGIGAAVALELATRDYAVHTVSRSQAAAKGCRGQHWCSDYSESSIAAVAQAIAESPGSLERLVIANGILHGEGFRPERALEHIDAGVVQQVFQINTVLPMQWLAAFSSALKEAELPRIAVLSARVGSIEDNRLGGWYSYRASKAALNMMLKSASVEFARRNKRAQLIAFHPGTVDTALSEPFQRGVAEGKLFSPSFVAQRLVGLLDEVPTTGDLLYLDWDGKPIPF
jgi:NAD(P)-dependent dehydrogenase (short-subunit alcohol dehydrogenase family)